MREPIWVYDNWAAYTDGIFAGDDTRLTEELALQQVGEVARLQSLGVRFDYHMMNAFWFAPDGAYRVWREADWPNGPARWIAACREQGLKPGLWFGANALWKIDLAPEWADSRGSGVGPGQLFEHLSLSEGGFLAHFMETLQHWYDRGIRMFEFDTANFDAASPATREARSPAEIRERNRAAFSGALEAFKQRNPDVVLVAFNGFGGDYGTTAGPFPFEDPIDLRWLGVLDSLYCGDIRVADVPQLNLWRSVDLYGDHMVRRYEQSSVPLEAIDPVGFVIGDTHFGFQRRAEAWRGMLLLTAARGGWKKTIYGDLTLLDDDDARWFAHVQRLFEPATSVGRTFTFGAIPGDAEPYGFVSLDATGALYTVVNPALEPRTIALPRRARAQEPVDGGRVLFRDAGFEASLDGAELTLGPGQMALAGFGRYARAEHDLGVQHDVVVPRRLVPLAASFADAGAGAIEATFDAPAQDVWVVVEQRNTDGSVLRYPDMHAAASPEDVRAAFGLRFEQVMTIAARQGEDIVPVQTDQDTTVAIFGLSWRGGTIGGDAVRAGDPITVTCTSSAPQPATLAARAYAIEW